MTAMADSNKAKRSSLAHGAGGRSHSSQRGLKPEPMRGMGRAALSSLAMGCRQCAFVSAALPRAHSLPPTAHLTTHGPTPDSSLSLDKVPGLTTNVVKWCRHVFFNPRSFIVPPNHGLEEGS